MNIPHDGIESAFKIIFAYLQDNLVVQRMVVRIEEILEILDLVIPEYFKYFRRILPDKVLYEYFAINAIE